MIQIGDHAIGEGQPCFIIAEAGVNHNGDLELGFKLVDLALNAGADAIKFQTFRPEALVSRDAPKADYQLESTAPEDSQLTMLQRLALTEDEYRQLKAYSDEQGIMFISTPFDRGSVDLLDNLSVPAFKVGSGELTNLLLLKHIASKGKPIIFSTGMGSIGEVETAIQTFREQGNDQLIALHCVSNYPSDPADSNLRAMATMHAAFNIPIGYSDHTMGIAVPIAAVTLGACVIEKHLTLDKALSGPDHRASLEPDEFEHMVTGIREARSALGHGRKEPAESERSIMSIARRSLVAARDLPSGTVLAESDLAVKRPGTGLPPGFLPHLVGRTVRIPISADSMITLDQLQ